MELTMTAIVNLLLLSPQIFWEKAILVDKRKYSLLVGLESGALTQLIPFAIVLSEILPPFKLMSCGKQFQHFLFKNRFPSNTKKNLVDGKLIMKLFLILFIALIKCEDSL